MPKKFSKFQRPDSPTPGRISDRDLHIIEAVLRYRFSPASELLRLVGGNHKVTLRRLTWLWRTGIVSRFAFADPRKFHSEFVYYLDSRASLDLLTEHGRLAEIHPQMEDEIRFNREAKYGQAWLDATASGKSLFLRHQLMVSRFRFMLEMACWGSAGQVELSMFRPDVSAYHITAPELKAVRKQGTGQYQWVETGNEENLPVKPDAIFSLTRHSPDGHRDDGGTLGRKDGGELHFAYEADRGTMPLGDMLKKLRAYALLIKRYKKHAEAFGIHPVRAVLIEAPTESRCLKLMELACHPLVAGKARRSGLFWFVPSFLFTQPVESRTIAPYLLQPDIIFQPYWGLPEVLDEGGAVASVSKHSLLDGENSRA